MKKKLTSDAYISLMSVGLFDCMSSKQMDKFVNKEETTIEKIKKNLSYTNNGLKR